MRVLFFSVPAHGDESKVAELNQVLARHRVREMERQFVADGPNSYWAISVTVLDAPVAKTAPDAIRKRIDYREELDAADFELFARLRDVRKRLAERDGVPPYLVFTNEQLADWVPRRVRSLKESCTTR